MTQSITVRHNIEVAHRLWLTPGKCEKIHGHSMWVDLTLYGEVNDEGFLAGLEFAELKQEFRAHLDTHYDHRLLLNKTDPFASLIHLDGSPEGEWTSLPGLVKVNGDPTTENIAKWIGDWALGGYGWLEGIDVKVDETAVNSSTYRWRVS